MQFISGPLIGLRESEQTMQCHPHIVMAVTAAKL
jgi:hypothetical protein